MIESFVDSWELFASSYLAAWFGAAVLALVGVPMVIRGRLFVGAAMTQAGSLGIAIGLELGHWFPALFGHVDTAVLTGCMAVAATIIASLGAMHERRNVGGETLVAWIYLGCGAATIVIVSHSPFGMKEIQERLMSSVIGANQFDVVLYASLLVAIAIAIWFAARPLLLVLVDREMAAACGISPRLWEIGLAIVVGLVVGVVLRGMGVLLTFGSLILPCAIAKGFCREARSLFWVAPLIAVGAAILGFLVGNHWDFPQGPLTVVMLGAALPVALIAGRIRGS